MIRQRKKAKVATMLKLITDMRWAIGLTPCNCVSSPEEVDYQDRLSAVKGDGARLLWCIENEAPENTIAQECERCKLLGRYEQLVGEKEAEDEWVRHQQALSTDDANKIREAVIRAVIEARDLEVRNGHKH